MDWYEPVETITVDTDEAGFSLTLGGDFTDTFHQYLIAGGDEVTLRLPQDVAVELLRQVDRTVGRWAAECPGPLLGRTR